MRLFPISIYPGTTFSSGTVSISAEDAERIANRKHSWLKRQTWWRIRAAWVAFWRGWA